MRPALRAVLLRGERAHSIFGVRLPGLITYWPLTEAAGTVADNAQGNAALDGAYVNSPTLAGAAFPLGGAVPAFDGTNDLVDVYSIALSAAFNPTGRLWMNIWLQVAAAPLTDGAVHCAFLLRDTASRELRIYKETTDYLFRAYHFASAVTTTSAMRCASTNWQMATLLLDAPNGKLQLAWNGVPCDVVTALGAWPITALNSDRCLLGGYRVAAATNPWQGNLGHAAIGAGALPTEGQLNALYEAVYPANREITFAGDSKATADDDWTGLLVAQLETATADVWRERPRRVSAALWKAAELHAGADAVLPYTNGAPEAVLMNIGVNDLTAGTAEATYEAELTGAIDAYRTQYPSATVYVAYPWRQGKSVQAATMKTWIDAVIATYPSGVAAGHDETVWLEGGDDGATMTSDGIHYSAAGQAECADQWQTVLGY